jgi:hypothetical protein
MPSPSNSPAVARLPLIYDIAKLFVRRTTRLSGIYLPAVADPDNQDDEPGFILLEDHPIGSGAEPVKRFLRSAEPFYVVLQRGRVPGQDP